MTAAERLLLIGIAEIIGLLDELAHPIPFRCVGGGHHEIADQLRLVAAEGVQDGEEQEDAARL